MIKKSVSVLAKEFARKTREDFADLPFYQLDETWPSIGVLDRFTTWLRGRDNWQSTDASLVHAAACYIAAMAHDLWSAYQANVVVDLRGKEVFITAKGGPYIPEGESVTIEIERELIRQLKHPKAEFPVIGDFQRTVGFDYNRVSLFALGVLLGPSPFVDGAWSMSGLSDFEVPMQQISAELAKTSAAFYSRLFPDEEIGANPELYAQAKLIYPPTLLDEDFPASKSAVEVVRYFKNNGFDNTQLSQLAHNFCLIPDERISLTGIVLCGALGGEISLTATALSESLGMFMPMLRTSVLLAREELFPEQNADWLSADAFDEAAADQFHSEQILNIYPFLKLSTRFIKTNFDNRKIREIIILICTMQIKDAITAIDSIVEEDPKFFELRLQKLWIESLKGDFKATEKGIKSLLSEPQAEGMPGIYELWGVCCSRYGDMNEAPRRFKAAYSNVSKGHELFAEISLHYAMALMSEQRFEDSLNVINDCQDYSATPIGYWTTKITIEKVMDRDTDALESIEKLRRIYPYERALIRELLFPNLTIDNLHK